jgi:hypothetical protein
VLVPEGASAHKACRKTDVTHAHRPTHTTPASTSTTTTDETLCQQFIVEFTNIPDTDADSDPENVGDTRIVHYTGILRYSRYMYSALEQIHVADTRIGHYTSIDKHTNTHR